MAKDGTKLKWTVIDQRGGLSSEDHDHQTIIGRSMDAEGPVDRSYIKIVASRR